MGVRNEEIGDYFPEFIDQYLESNPFLEPVMPWGSLSINENMLPQHSNDGPIIWARYELIIILFGYLKFRKLRRSNFHRKNHMLFFRFILELFSNN